MINRKVDKELRSFLMNDKRSLLVTGARQVGKTFSIRQAAKDCFEHVVEINFIEQPSAVQMFNGVTDAKELLLRISAFSRKTLIPGKTLIFFDEVQECKEIVTAIKFLVDEGSYRYVMSGSLLGVELKDIRSIPVGYMSEKEMYPLDLEEFAEAIGISKEVIAHLRECYEQRKPVDDFIHERMMEMIRLYLVVGGLPAAVQKYMDTNNLRRVYDEQRDIIKTYKRDITKYDPDHKLQIEEIYNLIPPELNAKNKRFILKELNAKARYSRYASGILWLKDAGVALPTYNIEEPRLPLLLNKQHNLFKLFLNDVGLLAAAYGGNIQLQLLSKESNINYGAIYENLVAQELYAHGFPIDHDLFYFSSKKQGELDFVAEYEGAVLPIEVKSGKDYDRHRALANVMQNEEYNIPFAIVFCQNNVQTSDKVVYLPIYMTMFLQQTTPEETLYKFNLTGL
ncbi:MAG: ATP-binding protein [Bacteroidaceae bacterium]|jgi:predicted AAA+ superfamily ATPase|nr:ATP-binding protein [Bacteroidaceae bacterium]